MLIRPWPALAGVLLLACADAPVAPRPSHELVDPAARATSYNAHVYGSFAVAAGGGVITSGPANFPGHPPAGPGTCVNGKWYNAQSKGTSGTLAKPHPHCFSPGATIEVVLEPITACYTGAQDAVAEEPAVPAGEAEAPAEAEVPKEDPKEPPAEGCAKKAAVKGGTLTYLLLTGVNALEEASVTGIDFKDELIPDETEGLGAITAYAIDAATLGTTNQRVGTLRLDLTQYNSETVSYVHLNDTPGCDIDEQIESPCLDKVVTAIYNPLPAEQGGIGPSDRAVEGFLWVTPADSPYNYTDME